MPHKHDLCIRLLACLSDYPQTGADLADDLDLPGTHAVSQAVRYIRSEWRIDVIRKRRDDDGRTGYCVQDSDRARICTLCRSSC